MRENHFKLARLRRELMPFRLVYSPRLVSTSTYAATLRRRGQLFAPAVVLTPHQIEGRGRGGNRWFSTTGCLTVTFAVAVDEHLAAYQLPLIAGLAVRNAVAEAVGHAPIQLKWPNDLVHEDRKLGGLLCERIDNVDLIGLGLNINLDPRRAPPALQPKITSLSQITGTPHDLTTMLIGLTRELQRTLQGRRSHTFAPFRAQYEQHHALSGRRITVRLGPGDTPLSGQCLGIDDSGRLLLRQRGTVHRILSGEVMVTT